MYVLIFKIHFFKNLSGLTDSILVPNVLNRNVCATQKNWTSLFVLL